MYQERIRFFDDLSQNLSGKAIPIFQAKQPPFRQSNAPTPNYEKFTTNQIADMKQVTNDVIKK